MARVKIIAVNDPALEGKNGGASSPTYCTDPQYIGRMGDTLGGLMTLSAIPKLIFVHVRVDDDGDWLFKPEHLQEVSE